ncbi:MAG: YlbF family regulator [Firmicutes bacterium]|nr:YlbF family regulator [Bacillota bacterium]MBQ6841850.1 YlbF family regulator [Bacillota bacterium]
MNEVLKTQMLASQQQQEDICTAAAALGQMVIDSSIYAEYRTAFLQLDEHPEQAERLRRFRKTQAMLRLMPGDKAQLAEDVAKLEYEWEQMCQIEVIGDFLYAEGRFSQLLLEMQEQLAGAIELWDDHTDPAEWFKEEEEEPQPEVLN